MPAHPDGGSGRLGPEIDRARTDRALAELEKGGDTEIPAEYRSFSNLTYAEREVLWYTLGRGWSDKKIAKEMGYNGKNSNQYVRGIRQHPAYKQAMMELLATAQEKLVLGMIQRDGKLLEGYDDILTGKVEERAAGGRSASALAGLVKTRMEMRAPGLEPLVERGARIQVGDTVTNNTLVLNMDLVNAEATQEEMMQIALGRPPEKFLAQEGGPQ